MYMQRHCLPSNSGVSPPLYYYCRGTHAHSADYPPPLGLLVYVLLGMAACRRQDDNYVRPLTRNHYFWPL